ncbi:MAG: hypothetical protein JWQ01_4409 [Massilia sp.]|jgi:hypothetical protein|nr:hypothetical protein [Massilia sp.]
MAIDRIPASLPPTPLPSRVGEPAFVPLAAQATGGALTLAVAESLALALPASTALGQAELQLELQPAMRADQLAMTRQLHFAPPDATATGTAWRLMARLFGDQQAGRREQDRGQHLPGSRFMADPAPAVLREVPGPETALWCFPVYAWGRQRMLLSVLDKAPKQAARPQGRRGPAALRLDLFVPGLGHVTVQMESFGDAVLLELATGEDEALACLRALVPQLTAVIAQAGLAVGRCRLGKRLGVTGHAPDQAQFAALPLALFKAMAAVAIVLSRPSASTNGP